jgi:heptosyltransferase-2
MPVEKILVRGVNWLGDAVISTAALLRLKEALPDCSISMLCPEKLGQLWEHHPTVDSTVCFSPSDSIFATGRKIRELHFDCALILPNSFRSAFEPWLGRIPQRIGYGGRARGWLLNKVVPRPPQRRMRKRTETEIKSLARTTHARSDQYNYSDHHIHHYLHLAAALGANPEPCETRLVVTDSEKAAFRGKWKLTGDGPAIFGLNPGAEYGPAKRWPVERFIEAALQISAQVPGRWLIFGSASDTPVAEEITTALRNQHLSVSNLAGKTTLRELMSGLAVCNAVLTNDTGPMHVAAALGTPVVVPFGSTSPELTGPGLPGSGNNALVKGDAPCAPCFRRTCPIEFRCMQSISPEAIAREFLRLYALNRENRSPPSLQK